MNRRYNSSNRFGNIGNNFRAAETQSANAVGQQAGGGYATYMVQQPMADDAKCEQAAPPSQLYDQQPLGENNAQLSECDDVAMSEEGSQETSVPKWMKSKIPGSGVTKVSKRERRRRQNMSLRRLLSPKNALMVLNEMMPGEQITNQFKVDVAQPTKVYSNQHLPNFCADLTFEEKKYKGYGVNKLAARNAAAEQAIRDLILKRMNGAEEGGADGEGLPMIQLASYALHKLFTEWECEGHHVPQLRPTAATLASAVQAATEAAQQPAPPAPARAERKPRVLPENAAAMHPCTLLTHMRPGVTYTEIGVEGEKPQNTVFSIALEVDGRTYVGKANNKREARKSAAAAACTALFGVVYQ